MTVDASRKWIFRRTLFPLLTAFAVTAAISSILAFTGYIHAFLYVLLITFFAFVLCLALVTASDALHYTFGDGMITYRKEGRDRCIVVTKSEMTLLQTKSELRSDVGRIRITKGNMHIGELRGITRFSEVRKYIEKNFR